MYFYIIRKIIHLTMINILCVIILQILEEKKNYQQINCSNIQLKRELLLGYHLYDNNTFYYNFSSVLCLTNFHAVNDF